MLLLLTLACFRLSPEDMENTLDADGDGFEDATWGGPDCDPTDAEVNPDAVEVCDGIDNDCSGAIDDEATDFGTWYADADGDGFGDADSPVSACAQPSGTVEDATDCDDSEALSYPGGSEVCDLIDNDCDGEVDEGASDLGTWYEDSDGDGYGDIEAPVEACTQPSGTVEETEAIDCDDTHANIYPGATEHCDDTDWDCDGESGYDINVPEHYATIQEAVDAAGSSDRVCVRAGTYNETLVITQTFPLLEGEGVGLTVIDAQRGGVPMRVYNVNETMKIKGFTLTGGYMDNEGAGLHVYEASPIFVDIELAENEMESGGQCRGAVLFTYWSDSVFRRVTVRDNIASCGEVWGLVNLNGGGSPHLENLALYDNTVLSEDFTYGGVVAYGYVEASLNNLIVAGDHYGASDDGTSIRAIALGPVTFDSFEVTNATFHGNTADAGTGDVRGLYWNYGFFASIKGLSATQNTCTGSSVRSCGLSGDFELSYSNLWDNDPTNYEGEDLTGTAGNLRDDPEYVDISAAEAQDWDLQLQAGSPLIDAGDPEILDADGSTSDIGAHGGPLGDSW